MDYLIGVTGGTASGKSTTCEIIKNRLNKEVEIISLDSFYLGLEEKQIVNFDHPSSFDWELLKNVLLDIKKGKSTQIPVYDFITI